MKKKKIMQKKNIKDSVLKMTETNKSFNKCDTFLSIACMIFFSTAVFLQFGIENRYKTKTSLISYFGFTIYKDYSVINPLEDFMQLAGIMSKIKDNKLYLKNEKFKLMSNIRITQRKVKLTNDSYYISPLILKDSFSSATRWKKEKGIHPYSRFDSDNEVGRDSDKDNSFLSKGGFLFEIKTDEDNTDIENKFSSFLELNSDISDTTSLVYDLVFANYENNYIVSVIFTNQFDQVGINKKKITTYILDRNLYNNGWSYFRFAMECAFVFFFLIYFIVFFVQLSYQSKMIIKSRKRIDSGITYSKCKVCCGKLFTDGFCICQFLTFIFSIVAICLWCAYVGYIYSNMDDIDKAFKEGAVLEYKTQNKLIRAGYLLEVYRTFAILTFLFMFVRLIKIFSRYVKTTHVFIKTIRYSISDIVSFFIFFLCLLLGFTLFTWIYYGRWFTRFNTLGSCFQQNFSFSMGIINSSLFMEMYNQVDVMTVFYFLVLIIIIRFIVIKIILAIMMHFFKLVNDKIVQEQTNKMIMSGGKKVKSSAITSLIFGYSTLMNGICDIICCRCGGGKNSYQKLEPEKNPFTGGFTEWKIKKVDCPEIAMHKELEVKEEKKKEDNDNNNKEKEGEVIAGGRPRKRNAYQDTKSEKYYDLNYEEDYEFTIRNAFFDSEKDKEKVQKYYEGKYRTHLVRSIVFLVFIVVTIVMYMLNVLSPWRANLFFHIGKTLNLTDQDTEEEPTYFQINSIDDIRNFVFEQLPGHFDTFYHSDFPSMKSSFIGNNLLIGNKLLMTVRKEQRNNDYESDFFIRKEEQLDVNDLCYENKDILNLSSTEAILWEKKRTYQKYGGFPYVLDIDNIDSTIREALIDSSNTFVILEFFLQNPDYQSGYYVELKMKSDYGAHFNATYQTYFLKYKLTFSPLDIVKYVFEVVFVILFFYYVYNFFKELKEECAIYDKWYRDVIYPQNLKVKDIRSRIEPEFLRKLRAVLSVSTLLDFSVLCMIIGIVYTRIMLWVREYDFKKMLEENDFSTESKMYELRDIFYSGTNARYNYEIVGAIIIFLSCIRLISLLNLGKFFSLLIRTFENSQSNIITFIIILILIQPCFVFYSHLAFGELNINYHKMDRSILSCMKVLFGYIDYKELQLSSKAFGPIFFFVYLIVINLILLNLFVSIIYTSYTKIKNQIMRKTETYDWMNVICCCRKKRRENNDNQLMIEAEFEYDKKMKKFETKMVLTKEKCLVNDFIKNETDQIKVLNDTLFDIQKKRKDVEIAYESTKIGKEYLFEDNLYKNIQENQLRSFNTQFLNNMLIINEQLENDILTIEEGIDHLNKHEEFMNYDELLETIKEKNKQVREKINEVDSKFAEMYDDLNEIYANKKKKEKEKKEDKKDEDNMEKHIEDKDFEDDNVIENN